MQSTAASHDLHVDTATRSNIPDASPVGVQPRLRRHTQGASLSSPPPPLQQQQQPPPQKQQEQQQTQKKRPASHPPNDDNITVSQQPSMDWSSPQRRRSKPWHSGPQQLGEPTTASQAAPVSAASQTNHVYSDIFPSTKSIDDRFMQGETMQLDELPQDSLYFQYPDVFQQKEVTCESILC